MTLPGSLFSAGDASDSAYRNLRTSTHAEARAGKAVAERLWREYYPYADDNFLMEVRSDFHARFWEMYLTCALVLHGTERGYTVSCPKQKKTGGPDILVEHANGRIWIEAVTATDGEPGWPDSIAERMPGHGYCIPEEKIILRYANAIAGKHKKYLDSRQLLTETTGQGMPIEDYLTLQDLPIAVITSIAGGARTHPAHPTRPALRGPRSMPRAPWCGPGMGMPSERPPRPLHPVALTLCPCASRDRSQTSPICSRTGIVAMIRGTVPRE